MDFALDWIACSGLQQLLHQPGPLRLPVAPVPDWIQEDDSRLISDFIKPRSETTSGAQEVIFILIWENKNNFVKMFEELLRP